MKRRWAEMANCIGVVALFTALGGTPAPVAKDVAAESPWGPADEIGTLNMMTDASRFDALKQISGGTLYDLAVELFVGMPTCCDDAFGDPSFQMWMTHAPARGAVNELVSHSGDAFSMSTHTGTHIDSLCHFGLKGEIWNEISADDALGDRGWTRSGAEKYPPIVARGVLIDVARSKDVEHLPPSYSITVNDLQTALREQGTSLAPGDVVLIRTGLMSRWPDQARFQLFTQPGLSLEAAQWLADEQQAMLLGADNLGLESFPSMNSENFAPVHTFLLAEKGVSIMELLWLEELSRDQVHEFVFIACPLKIRGATGAPIRPLAIPIQGDQ